jgi:UDP-2,3-diacylglucosamine pyrophosphatase LpxH
VICGHIHHAVINASSGLRYINCGDWVENCTAVVEHFDGTFEVVRWTMPASLEARALAALGARPGA